ncbi:MAG: DNA polymerase [Candidatus Binatia bacterium]
MLRKPDICKPCKWYQTGNGIVYDELISGSSVFVLGQNPGANEESGKEVVSYGVDRLVTPRPFIGKTGKQMNETYLPLAGLTRGEDVSIGNVLRCRKIRAGRRTNDMPSGGEWSKVTRHCTESHLQIPGSTRLIVAQGVHAFRLLGGQGSVYDWRGYLLPEHQVSRSIVQVPRGCRVFVTLHIADLNHDPKYKLAMKADWIKVGRILTGEWPKPPPKRITKLEWDEEVDEWFDRAERASFAAIDGEWNPRSGRLRLLGLGSPGSVILQWANPQARDIRFLGRLRRLVQRVPTVFHNAKADTLVIADALGIRWKDYLQVEDTMIAHAKLWGEHPHTLDYVGSIYSDYNKKKHLKNVKPFDYNAGDVADTVCAWSALSQELDRAPGVARGYREDVRLIPYLQRSERVGIRLDKKVINDKIAEYQGRVDTAAIIAQAAVGWPINVGSANQVRHQLHEVEGLKKRRKKKTRAATVDKDAIATYRAEAFPFDEVLEAEEGVTIPYIQGRIREGAHAFIEARKLYSASKYVVANYLGKLKGKARCFPSIETHTQDNHRWSYTNPAVATFPHDLRDILVADPGWPWLGWDHDGAELRIIACESRSKWLLEALEKGYDIHTLTTCSIFRLPLPPDLVDPHESISSRAWREKVKWRGKDDIRRVFCKRFRFRLNYGGQPEFCMDIPGAVSLGFDKRGLGGAARAIWRQDPDLARWRKRQRTKVLDCGLAVDFNGRLRRFFTNSPDDMVRQMLDFAMQAGTQSIETKIFLEIADRFGDDVVFKWGAHDSQYWAIRDEMTPVLVPQIKAIVTQPREINGIMMEFPATFKGELT